MLPPTCYLIALDGMLVATGDRSLPLIHDYAHRLGQLTGMTHSQAVEHVRQLSLDHRGMSEYLEQLALLSPSLTLTELRCSECERCYFDNEEISKAWVKSEPCWII